MAFYGYHGNLASEQEQGQRFFVDVEIITDLTKAGQSDQLEDSINYFREQSTTTFMARIPLSDMTRH